MKTLKRTLAETLKGSLYAALILAAVRPALAQDTTFYNVSYIEVKTSSRGQAIAILKSYRDTTRRDESNISTQIFEQADRPGHFCIIEAWKTSGAFDAKTGVRKALQDQIEPMRTSGWDMRPYKTLSVASGPEATTSSVYVISHVDVAPDPKVAGMLTTLADASRHEQGNIRFDVLLHTMRSNHFEVIEIWQSQKALENHANAAHTKKYRDDIQAALGSPLDERIYRVLE